jgi:hypothetical protein
LLFTFYCCNIAAELDFLKDSFEVNNPIYNQHQGCYNALYNAFFKYLAPPPRAQRMQREAINKYCGGFIRRLLQTLSHYSFLAITHHFMPATTGMKGLLH